MISSEYSTMNDNPQRKIEGKVELHSGSTTSEFLPTHNLQEITVSRSGEKGKFFGFGICQKAVIKVLDRDANKPLSFIKGDNFNISFRANSVSRYAYVCPTFYIKEAKKDEKTNVFTLTAYDVIDNATAHVFDELGMEAPYTIKDVVEHVASLLGVAAPSSYPTGFDLSYEKGANFGGDENLRAVLNAVAEVTQTIYYVDKNDQLVFKRLDKTGTPVLPIPKKDYFELTTALPATITDIMSVTELGENLNGTDHSGVIQYVRDNPFWNNLDGETLAALLAAAIERISGLTIVPYNLKWRGNFLTEIGDKVSLEAKDGHYISTFILDDSFTYKGGFNQSCSWEYDPDSEKTTASNPITIGEKLNQTFARVDKIEKNITLYVGDIVSEVLPSKIDEAIEDITTDLSKAIKDVEDALREDMAGELSGLESNLNESLAGLESTLNQNIADAAEDLSKEIDEVEAGINKAIADATSNLVENMAALEATTSQHTENISQLQLTSTSINNEVSSLKTTTTNITNELGEVVAAQTTINNNIAQLQIKDNSITQEVNGLKTTTTTLNDEVNNVKITQETIQNDIGTLQVGSNSINASVTSVEQKIVQLENDLGDNSDQVNERIDKVASEVALKLDKNAVEITVDRRIEAGVDKVTTASKKYTFDDEGLNISAADSSINTTVTENGMRIYENTKEVLTANSEGVKAADLHAYTFLIIGENSRMEDRGRRTACFWIGKAGG